MAEILTTVTRTENRMIAGRDGEMVVSGRTAAVAVREEECWTVLHDERDKGELLRVDVFEEQPWLWSFFTEENGDRATGQYLSIEAAVLDLDGMFRRTK